MDDNKERYLTDEEIHMFREDQTEGVRTVLTNAIKMQALYSNGQIKFVETSHLIN